MKNELTLRISSGSLKNKRLVVPKIEGFRAVQEIAKQSVFSMLGDKVEDSVCLDLYSGSGNIGIEALSRGARECTFVDQNYDSIGAITENIKKCSLEDKAYIIKGDAVKFVANTDKNFDLVFLDPFYEETSHIFLVKNLANIVNESGLIVFFHGENLDIKALIKDRGLNIVDERKFGKSLFTFLERAD